MKTTALVLSYDPNRVCTENTILQYERLLGPEHFRFVVPFQENREISDRIRSEVSFVRCDRAIQQTVAALLDQVDANEMVYWCIDDKFPLEIDAEAYRTTLAGIHNAPEIDGVNLAVARRLSRGEGLRRRKRRLAQFGRTAFFERTNFNQFWLHQFMRAKCIAHVFAQFPDQVPMAKELDRHVDAITENPFRMYVANRNKVVFGESTARGAVTDDLVATAASNGLFVDPDRTRIPDSIRIGRMDRPVQFKKTWGLF